MIFLKTDEEIEIQRESSLLVGKTLAEVARRIRPGIKTIELDRVAEEYIRDHHAEPGFKGYGGFPATLCISVNDQVVHGIPGNNELRDGDIVSVDCGVLMNGFYGDSAYTFEIGEVAANVRDLVSATKQSLAKGIEVAIDGMRIGDIGFAIQSFIDPYGYGIVRELVGHGVGRKLHEKPEVPNYGRRGSGIKLLTGMVIAIEPMINMGVRNVKQEQDGWTIKTADGKPSAHFEHTVAVRNGRADVLSSFEEIENVLQSLKS
jgi:methionyl aminopeptidase